ncbi:LysM peptidoglycan-binding domain-containing protein [Halomonas koreensis]|uniref:LysM domain-containing protein n=1 Tax=Halomonas koreensis TaxID=245385 RepID=A0ABU1G710_9GAMM|nr:LysM domain-containing protein [Halomonas koreensis]MDR5868723.1 LysM domain-containing protein [Halomonas koreensis]
MEYTVKHGQSLAGIASEKGVSISSIMERNPALNNPNRLQAGDVLDLPETSEVRDNRCPDDIMGDSPCADVDEVEPGFHIVKSPQTMEELKDHLFAGQAGSEVDAMLERLNPALMDGVSPGQVVVLSDPRSMQCTEEENLLMQIAQEVNEINAELTYEEAQRTVDYYDLLGAATGGAGAAIGNTASGMNQHAQLVESKLREIEALYQRVYERTGKIGGEEFYARRRVLFEELDAMLDRVTRMGLGIPEHPDLRHALGLSTKSTVHHWRQAGSSASGIPGYADNYGNIANASKWLGRAGYVGLGLSAVSTHVSIREACASGREEECQIARVREWAGFGGGIAGGAAGGAAAGAVAGGICLALGVPTGGLATLACGVVLVGAGGYVGGEIGGEAMKQGGEWVGEAIYGASQ